MDETLDAGVVLVRGSAAGFAQEIRAGRHRFVADEPVADGGTDTVRARTTSSWVPSGPERR